MAYRQLSRSVTVVAGSITLIGVLASMTAAASDNKQEAREGNPNQVFLKAQKAGQPAQGDRSARTEYCGGGEDPHLPCPLPPTCAGADAAVIASGYVQLGVCRLGQLNVPNGGTPSSGYGSTTVGLRYRPHNADGLSPGCHCEGWGAGDAISGVSGSANQNYGAGGLTPVSFTRTPTTAVSVVNVGAKLQVKQDYHPSPSTPFLYENTVTLTNISSGPVNPRYRRVMDWDVEPTAFSEHVTNHAVTPSYLKFMSDDGFATADPFGGQTSINGSGEMVDNGPSDHGALFDFDFPSLAAGKARTFKMYYGAAGSEALALQALAAVGAEVYSLGQTGTDDGKTNGTPNTFMFAFKGIGECPAVSGTRASATQVEAQLTRQMTPRGAAATTAIAALTRSSAYPMAFRAPKAGSASVRWYLVGRKPRHGKAKQVLFATGRGVYSRAGKATIVMRLTPQARRALRSTRHVRLVARGTFAPAGSKVGATTSFSLSR